MKNRKEIEEARKIKYKERRERKRNKGRLTSENLMIQELDAEEEPEDEKDGRTVNAGRAGKDAGKTVNADGAEKDGKTVNADGAGEGAGTHGKRAGKKTGKNKAAVRAVWITAAVFAAGICFYAGLAEYYKNGFSYGTWINGIYCTGKSVEEVNQELLRSCSYDGITVYDGQGGSYLITAEEIGYTFDFEEALRGYLKEQNPYLWVGNLFSAKEKRLTPVISFEEGNLLAALEKIPDYADTRTEEDRKVDIRKTADGYMLTDERLHVLNKTKTVETMETALRSFEAQIDLNECGCYENLPYSEEMKRELERWEQIEEFQNCGIVYRFGDEEVPVDASVVCDWIAVDEEGNYLTDEQGRLLPEDEKIEAFVDRLADEYDTLGGTRSFQTTRGETITVEGGIYGNQIDREAEKEYLKQAFRNRAEEVHVPAYLQMGWAEGKNDIGDTYIEVDMTEQMMYYYRDGRLEIETPVVTGNTGRRMGTPAGVNYVYGKARNRILQGPGYASHVNFWMPVKGNIGIHDAAWRSEYGGEIYKTGGSHGCINTPYDAMSKLYDMAEVGTPVVMFY